MKKLLSILSIPIIVGFFFLLLFQIRVPYFKSEALIFSGLFALLCLFAYTFFFDSFMKRTQIGVFFQHRITRFALIFLLSTTFFFLLPNIIFDDAAIVLRYMDNFGKGYFFKYNANDAPVYGLSGFLHGLLGGLICYFHLASSENALLFSNYVGFIFASWFLYLIYCRLMGDLFFSFLAWAITLTSARSFLIVSGSGLETSLHLAIVMAGIYYLLTAKKRSLYFFCALMIISKLDAVPVAMVLLGYQFVFQLPLCRFRKTKLHELKIFVLFFLLPLVTGLACISLLFGSPLPQSAFAKLYYHSHPNNSWFPFLQYFTDNHLKLLILVAGLLLWFATLLEAAWKRQLRLLDNSLFGFLFIATMGLYYFYNPSEQMIWYYAMPEIFIVMQVVYGCNYFLNTYSLLPLRWKPLSVLFLLFCFSILSWRDVSQGLWAMRESTTVVESERAAIGNYIGKISSVNDTLLSSHGLPTRFFKGYVIDLSGLNSKLATNYKLKPDSIIDRFRPNFIINHAYPSSEKILDHYNYRLGGVYQNITISNYYHSWVLLQRGPIDSIFKVKFLDTLLNKGKYRTEGVILKMDSQDGVLVIKDTVYADLKKLHFGIKRDEHNALLFIDKFRNGNLLASSVLNIAKFSTSYSKVNHIQLDVSGTDSVTLRMRKGKSFLIVEPIFEVGLRKTVKGTYLSPEK